MLSLSAVLPLLLLLRCCLHSLSLSTRCCSTGGSTQTLHPHPHSSRSLGALLTLSLLRCGPHHPRWLSALRSYLRCGPLPLESCRYSLNHTPTAVAPRGHTHCCRCWTPHRSRCGYTHPCLETRPHPQGQALRCWTSGAEHSLWDTHYSLHCWTPHWLCLRDTSTRAALLAPPLGRSLRTTHWRALAGHCWYSLVDTSYSRSLTPHCSLSPCGYLSDFISTSHPCVTALRALLLSHLLSAFTPFYFVDSTDYTLLDVELDCLIRRLECRRIILDV